MLESHFFAVAANDEPHRNSPSRIPGPFTVCVGDSASDLLPLTSVSHRSDWEDKQLDCCVAVKSLYLIGLKLLCTSECVRLLVQARAFVCACACV